MTSRNTIQKALVLAAVHEISNHPTSDEVYKHILLKHPNISKSTVYRNLNALCDMGEIVRVEIPNAADRVDISKTIHCHLVCKKCGEIFDVSLPLLVELEKQISNLSDFIIEKQNVVFTGICSQCK